MKGAEKGGSRRLLEKPARTAPTNRTHSTVPVYLFIFSQVARFSRPIAVSIFFTLSFWVPSASEA